MNHATITVNTASKQLSALVTAVADHGPLEIADGDTSAILVTTALWNELWESLHLACQPGMMDKIRASAHEARTGLRTLDQVC
jgi:PHD/YefM family antitoxin component YafN of YafNO toxin-antitoxin module